MAERRRQIIERAAGVIYRRGFGATTIADILSAATVGKGNFYHYFEGKQDFGLAIIDTLARELEGVDLDELFSPMKPPLRRLDDYLQLVSKARQLDASADPLCTLASELGAIAPYAEHLRRAFASLIERFEALVAEYAAERGTSVDAGRLARMLVAQVHGLCVQLKVDHDIASFENGLTAVPTLLTESMFAKTRSSAMDSVPHRTPAPG
jgi:TetR/AcrR family transcriptional regulator, transcriptional repressor for nem operon